MTHTPAGPDEFLGVGGPRVAARRPRDPPVAAEAYPQPAEEGGAGREGGNRLKPFPLRRSNTDCGAGG